jgi:hypothetical protein
MTSEMRRATWRGLDGRLPDSREYKRDVPLAPTTPASNPPGGSQPAPDGPSAPTADRPDDTL